MDSEKFSVVFKDQNRVKVKGYKPQGTITRLASYGDVYQVWHVRSRPVKYLLVKLTQETNDDNEPVTMGEILKTETPGRNWYAATTQLRQEGLRLSQELRQSQKSNG